MRPIVKVSIDGKPVSGLFLERLISIRVVDREGTRSDTVDLELEDGTPFVALPKPKAKIKVWMGYATSGLVYKGEYTASEIEVQCLPYLLNVPGQGADVTEDLKTQKERHFDNKSVKDIVKQIAGEHGLKPVIHDAVAAHVYEWLGQQSETDMHLLERLARRHGALFAIKDGRLVFAEKGTGKSASGKELPVQTISQSQIIEGSCRVRFGDRGRYKTIKAYYQDPNKARRVGVEAQGDKNGKGTYKIRETFSSEGEAREAAKARAKELLRGEVTTTVSIEGRPDFLAGQPFTYAGVRPGVDGLEFIAEGVTHSYSKGGGLLTEIEGKAKAGSDTA
ncbi:phage late control D family protein [Pseudovibrio sp. WM33]|uniref:phage late control D family protein n=1 Tax=Pseudovibrio sp. WM33 TaxID=1735585 RepID=UPI0007AE8E94|nr:contractile injection system protein, VgrG/Pvc8 family [Pseudovibrio sp. WM33]KZL28377.1 Phage late control gene D protein (GPD) [Pseudovibrio sp. WM33]